MKKIVSNSEVAALALIMVNIMDIYIAPKKDSRLYICTRLNECKYDEQDLEGFVIEMNDVEDTAIDISLLQDDTLTIYDIAKNILINQRN